MTREVAVPIVMSDAGPRCCIRQIPWLPLLAAFWCLTWPAAAAAQAVPPLTDHKLEDLMRIDVQRVFGASDRLQPVTEAPSSVTIITADEIARYGYRTLADVLRGVRGLYVSDDRQYSFLGVRGLSRLGDFNTRVLLLVNGHPVNDNVYSQAQVGSEFGIDASMFERVEVIRGPASSRYGTGAFLAIVNVITRSGASLGGASVAVEAGSLDTRLVRAAAGQRFANGIDVAVSGTYQQSGGLSRLYIPAFDSAATNRGFADGLDGERVSQLYGHFGFKDFTITAAYGYRDKDVATAPYGGAFNAQMPRSENFDRRTLLDAVYEHTALGTHVTVRGSFDRYDYNAINPFSGPTAGAPPIVNYDAGVGTRLGFDGRVTKSFPGRQSVTAGAEYFENLHQNMANHNDNLPGTVIEQTSRQGALYLEDAVRLKPWLIVSAGLRYDAYQGQTNVTPRAAVIVLPSSHQSFKYLYGQAFRAPNVFERSYYSSGVPNRDLRAESIDTHEVVWERYTAAWLRTSVSAYQYKARDLITFQPDPDGLFGLTFANGGSVQARGLELEAEARLKGGLQTLGSYAVQRAAEAGTGLSTTNSPQHMAKFRLSIPGPAKQSSASVEWQYLGRRTTLGGGSVAPRATADVMLRQPLGRSFELSFGARNLFNQRYADPVSDAYVHRAIGQNGRTVRVGLQWSPGTR